MSPVALCSETTWKRVIYFSRYVLDELNHCSYGNACAPLCLWFLNVSSFSWILAAVSFFKSHSCALRSTKRQSRRIVLQSTIIHANKWLLGDVASRNGVSGGRRGPSSSVNLYL